MIEVTHIAAHSLIALGYVYFALVVPNTLSDVIKISPITSATGGGFFITCGLTHFGLAVHRSYTAFFTVADHLQAVFVIAFAVFLIRDLRQAAALLRRADAARAREAG
jgi:hypothetical protein